MREGLISGLLSSQTKRRRVCQFTSVPIADIPPDIIPVPSVRRRRIAGCGSPDHRDVRDNVSLKFDSLSVVLSDKTHTTTRKRSDTGHSRKDVQARSQFANISMPRKIVRVVKQLLAVSRLFDVAAQVYGFFAHGLERAQYQRTAQQGQQNTQQHHGHSQLSFAYSGHHVSIVRSCRSQAVVPISPCFMESSC